MLKEYTFTVYMSGIGIDADDAWENACEAFIADPGSTPITHLAIPVTEEDPPCQNKSS